MNEILLVNLLGFLALLCYVLTLLPTTIRVVFPATKSATLLKKMLKHRRLIGVIAFYLGLWHAAMMIGKRNFDFFNIKTYSVYAQGITSFFVFAILTVTSNDWSVKKLKKNWKRLHQLTYLCLLLLLWHIWDKMSGHWSLLTPFSYIVLIGMMILLLIRKLVESRNELPLIKRNKNKGTAAVTLDSTK